MGAIMVMLVAMAIILWISLTPINVNSDPPKWSTQKSALWISLTRPTFCILVMLMWIIIMLDYLP